MKLVMMMLLNRLVALFEVAVVEGGEAASREDVALLACREIACLAMAKDSAAFWRLFCALSLRYGL